MSSAPTYRTAASHRETLRHSPVWLRLWLSVAFVIAIATRAALGFAQPLTPPAAPQMHAAPVQDAAPTETSNRSARTPTSPHDAAAAPQWSSPREQTLSDLEPPDPALGLRRVGTRGRFVAYAQPSLGSPAAALLAVADTMLNKVAEDLPGLPQPAQIQLRFVREASQLATVAPQGRGAPAYAVGVAYPDLGVLSVAFTRTGQPIAVDETLRHELAHLALGAALAGRNVPRWLHEGFAYQHAGEWTWARTETLATMAWGGNIASLDELEHGFPAAEQPASRAYAQSYDFVGYLARRGRWQDHSDDGDRWAFRNFLAAYAQSGDLDRAATRAFGRPLKQLYDEWRDDLRERYMLLPAGVAASLLWFVAAAFLMLGWMRRRRQFRQKIAAWAMQERAEDARRQAEAAAAHAAQLAWLQQLGVATVSAVPAALRQVVPAADAPREPRHDGDMATTVAMVSTADDDVARTTTADPDLSEPDTNSAAKPEA